VKEYIVAVCLQRVVFLVVEKDISHFDLKGTFSVIVEAEK
jgi:hypothetical protein